MQNLLDLPTAPSVKTKPLPPPVPSQRNASKCFVSPGVPLYRGLGTTPASRLTPPTLPEGVESVAEIREPWFAVHTQIQSRGPSDFALAWQLHLNGLPYYHPQAERIVVEKTQRRKKVVSLFAGYLFAAGPLAERFCLDNRDLCDSILREPRAGQIAADLLVIQGALKQDPRLKTCDIDRAGIKVRVTRGPYINQEGVTDDVKVQDGAVVRVYLHIRTMGRLTPLDLDVSDLERI